MCENLCIAGKGFINIYIYIYIYILQAECFSLASPIQGSVIVLTLQLTQQNSPPTLGLRLLRLTSEELCVARGLSSPRAKFLRKCFTDQVRGGSGIISIAHSQIPATLQLILLRLTQAIAEPNATTGTTRRIHTIYCIHTHSNYDGADDAESELGAALQCLQHMFSWIDVSRCADNPAYIQARLLALACMTNRFPHVALWSKMGCS